MTLEEMKRNLSSRVGDREFITPKEFEKYVMPIPVTKQTRMRSERRFPIPHNKIGKSIFYHIDDVVKYAVLGKQESTTKITANDLNTKAKNKYFPPKLNINSNADDFDLSHALALKYILDELKEEIEDKVNFKNMLEKFIDSQDLHDKLQKDLSTNENSVRKKKVIKV